MKIPQLLLMTSPLTEEQSSALNALLASLDTNQEVNNNENVLWVQYQVAKKFIYNICSN